MDKWLKVSVAVALLLAGSGAFYHFVLVLPEMEQTRQDQESAARRADGFRLSQQRSAVEECQQAARLFYDVKWAAACMSLPGEMPSDLAAGHAECDLPTDKAAVVNSWLDQAEQACMAEVRAGLDP